MTRTVRTTTATEAPAATSWTAANWAAPAATKTDIPSASNAESPLPIAAAPKAVPNGTRASKTGEIALAPETKASPADAALDSCPEAPSRPRVRLPGRIFGGGLRSRLLPG